MKKLLLVIDMQNDFIYGTLGTKEAVAILPKVIEKVARFDGDLSGLVPDILHDVIRARLGQNRKDGQP